MQLVAIRTSPTITCIATRQYSPYFLSFLISSWLWCFSHSVHEMHGTASKESGFGGLSCIRVN
jgi:hypothetical protein